MRGAIKAAELDSIEEFYESRKSPVNLDLCPLAGSWLAELLGRRSYRIVQFNNVMVRRIDPALKVSGDRIREASPDEADVWTATMVRGFSNATTCLPTR